MYYIRQTLLSSLEEGLGTRLWPPLPPLCRRPCLCRPVGATSSASPKLSVTVFKDLGLISDSGYTIYDCMSTTDLAFCHTCDWLPPSAREHQPTLIEVWDYFRSLSAAQRSCMSEIFTLLKLVMLIPGTNSVSDWSASAVHKVKIYLRSTMTQLLFRLLVLHVHKERTDTLQVTACLNEFVTGSGHRSSLFGTSWVILRVCFSVISLK